MREKAGIAGNADHTERKIDVHPNQATANDEVTENVPRLRACAVTKSLKRGTNSGHLEVIGKKVNRGTGYGFEIPCVYKFTGCLFAASASWLSFYLPASSSWHSKGDGFAVVKPTSLTLVSHQPLQICLKGSSF